MNELEWPSELTSFCSQFGKDFSNRELEVIVDLSLREEGVLLTRLVSCSGIRQEKLRSRMLEIYETAINLSKKNRLISFSESVSGRHNKIIGRDLRDYRKNRNEIKHFEKMLGLFNFKENKIGQIISHESRELCHTFLGLLLLIKRRDHLGAIKMWDGMIEEYLVKIHRRILNLDIPNSIDKDNISDAIEFLSKNRKTHFKKMRLHKFLDKLNSIDSKKIEKVLEKKWELITNFLFFLILEKRPKVDFFNKYRRLKTI